MVKKKPMEQDTSGHINPPVSSAVIIKLYKLYRDLEKKRDEITEKLERGKMKDMTYFDGYNDCLIEVIDSLINIVK